MDSREWNLIKELFSQAVELPSDQQQAFIENACKGHHEREQKILQMLRAESTGDQTKMFDEAMSNQVNRFLNEKYGVEVGARISAYKIDSQIGEGGMGKVYLASRADESFEQKVAIKVIDSKSVNAQTVQRFEMERQILANFDHPNIARLIDGGTTENGLPYIVMEYIEGRSITEYCQADDKTLEERLSLFVQVAKAVNYAHQNLVIHRDIKPSNILVTEVGEVKLLDFGIAKLQAENEEENLDVTQEQQRVFTPSNASPEQLIGQQVTTRTDVYELGALLYHLLTDKPLFSSDSDSRANLEKAIIEQEPLKPSVLVERHLQEGQNNDLLNIPSDLDTITLKALKKDPQRRYQSAYEMVEDIERYLNNFPILARTDSIFYRTNKFVRRNKALTASLFASAITVLAFVLIVINQNIEIEKQNKVAENEALIANHVVDFMVNIFKNANPEEHQGSGLSAEDLLQTASESLEELTQSESIKKRLSIAIGRSFQKMGKLENALPLIEDSIERNHNNTERERRALARNLYRLGDLYTELVDTEKAENNLRESIEIYTSLIAEFSRKDDEHELTFPLVSLGSNLSILGEFEEAKQLNLQALVIAEKHLGDEHFEVGEIYNSLGHVYRNLGELENALDALKKGLAIVRKAQGEDTLQSAHSLNQIASTLFQLNRYQEALPMAIEGYSIRERIHKEPHPEVAASLGMIANIMARLKRFDEAITYRQKSISLLTSVFGEEHAYVGMSYGALAKVLFEKGDVEKSKNLYHQALVIIKKVLPEGNINITNSLDGLAKIHNLNGEFESAIKLAEESYEIKKLNLPKEHWKIAVTAEILADSLQGLKRSEEASQYYQEAKTILIGAFNAEDERVVRIIEKLSILSENIKY